MDDLTGLDLILAERERQITEEGYTSEHDDMHDEEELAAAAAVYAAPTHLRRLVNMEAYLYPWNESSWKPTPKDRVRELTKAGALIIAEIDRLLRLRGATR